MTVNVKGSDKMRDKLCKDGKNTSYRWGVIVGQPTAESIHPIMSNVGQWLLANHTEPYRTCNGKKVVCFNSLTEAQERAKKVATENIYWNFEAKKIPN